MPQMEKSNSAGQMSKHDNHWCVFLFVSESCSSVLRGLCVLPFLFFPTERASTSGNPYRHICLCTLTFCLSWWNQEKGFDITNGLMAGGKKYLWKVDLNTAGLFKTVIYWIGHRWPKFTWSKLAEGNLIYSYLHPASSCFHMKGNVWGCWDKEAVLLAGDAGDGLNSVEVSLAKIDSCRPSNEFRSMWIKSFQRFSPSRGLDQ